MSTVLSVQKVALAGLTPALVAADSQGNEFINGGRAWFHVNNGGASQITVTIDSLRPCDYGVDHDVTVDVPTGEERKIGPFDPKRFNNSSGMVAVSYSDVTSVTVGAFEV